MFLYQPLLSLLAGSLSFSSAKFRADYGESARHLSGKRAPIEDESGECILLVYCIWAFDPSVGNNVVLKCFTGCFFLDGLISGSKGNFDFDYSSTKIVRSVT